MLRKSNLLAAIPLLLLTSSAFSATNTDRVVAIQQAQIAQQAAKLELLEGRLQKLSEAQASDTGSLSQRLNAISVPTGATMSLANCAVDDVVLDNQGSAFGRPFSNRQCNGNRVAIGIRVWQIDPSAVADRVICCDMQFSLTK